MVKNNMTFENALKFLRTKRSICEPNLSFASVLLALQRRQNNLDKLKDDFS